MATLGRSLSHEQSSEELKRQRLVADRRSEEIQNLAVAKTSKDMEIVDLVQELE